MPSFISPNISLAPHTTLGIGGQADFFCTVTDVASLQEAVAWAKAESLPITILGGGSNVLVSDAGVRGLVIKIALTSLDSVVEEDLVRVTVGAGYGFDELVALTTLHGWWGLENLSAIPGTVGATPVQNVGAYGVEVADLIESVTIFDVGLATTRTLTKSDCQFGYRDSFFKKPAGKTLIVIAVTFVLHLTATPRLTYKDLAQQFGMTTAPTQAMIRATVMVIRGHKFPDWHVLGTAGSFFKNPSVSSEYYDVLKAQHPALPGYPNHDGTSVKLALGWILEHILHKKGYRAGNVSLYTEQALVLVNHGGASAQDVFDFSERIGAEVYATLGISIEREVQLVGAW